MALKPDTYAPFVGRITAATPSYPYGSSKVETAPAAGDGTPYEIGRANEIFGILQALLWQAAIVPTGTADTALVSQYLESIIRLAGTGDLFVDTGAADAYALDYPGVAAATGTIQAPTAYYDGMPISFYAANANAGASTVDVAGLGAKDIQLVGGTALSGGEIRTDKLNNARYNLAGDRFEIEAISSAPIGALDLDNIDTTPSVLGYSVLRGDPLSVTITALDDGVEGQHLTVISNGNNKPSLSGAGFLFQGGATAWGSGEVDGDTVSIVLYGGVWYETSRSDNT